MFIAIVVPDARKSRPVLITALLAVLLSVLFRHLPVISGLSSGWRIIIITVAVSAFSAWRFPIEDRPHTDDADSQAESPDSSAGQ
jgi:hypothetical protein